MEFRGLGVSLFVVAVCAPAQVPDKFTNLKVLRPDISKAELSDTMRGFSFSLGVRCQHCHAGPDGPSLEGMDFASDEKETKRTARAMLQMVEAINREHVGKLDKAAPVRVECVTCHRGLNRPRTLVSVLREELDNGGPAAAVVRYRELRKDDYGSGRYDFSETSLNLLTESLHKARRFKEAAAMMEPNAEHTRLTRWGYALLAMSHRANGEIEKAKADFRKLLEIDLNRAWAQRQLEELEQGKR
jgi:tetratricopeptide (TPR) repeat protein